MDGATTVITCWAAPVLARNGSGAAGRDGRGRAVDDRRAGLLTGGVVTGRVDDSRDDEGAADVELGGAALVDGE